MRTTPFQQLMSSALSITDADEFAVVDRSNLKRLDELLESNRSTIQLARQALKQHCGISYRPDQDFLAERCDHLSAARTLAFVLRAEVWVTTAKHDYQAAALAGSDLLELSNVTRRGGLIIDLLASVWILGQAIDSLRRIRIHFDNRTRRELISTLSKIDSEQESFEEIALRDQNWEAEVGGSEQPQETPQLELSDLQEIGIPEESQLALIEALAELSRTPRSDLHRLYEDQDRTKRALLRMLAIDLSLREVREKTGAYPDQISETVLCLPKAMLVDPWSGGTFHYQRLLPDEITLCSPATTTELSSHMMMLQSMGAPARGDLSLDSDDLD